MAQPVSNGAIVVDETLRTSVDVNFNFSNTGSGGTLEVLQSDRGDHIRSGYPPVDDARWVTAVDENGNPPSEGAQTDSWSHVGFSQPRGSVRFYYSRRKTGNAVELGRPYPVGEHVPTFPYIGTITHNASFTTATVNVQMPEEPVLPYSSSRTEVYYYQSTEATQPVWKAVSPTQISPEAHWSASPTFTIVPNVQYYYYVLAWTHNNPGPDGAAISAVVSRNASSKQGLEVYNEHGTKIITLADRLIRFVQSGSVTVNRGSFANIYVAGMANDDTWGVALGMPPNLLWSTEATFEKSTDNLRIDYVFDQQYFGIASPPFVPVTYYVFRT